MKRKAYDINPIKEQ